VAAGKMQVLEKKYSQDLADIFRRFFNQYKYPVGVIYGNPDTGKSDTAVLAAEIGLREGYLDYFASNMKTQDGTKITSLEEVKHWHRNQPGRKLYILDESAINVDARNPFSKQNRGVRHEIFIARKFKVHWFFILQEIKDVDTWKNSELTGMIIKKGTYGGETGQNYKAMFRLKWEEDLVPFYDFPRTSLYFDTMDIAEFTLNKQLNDITVSIQGEPAQVARFFKQHHSSDKAAIEMSKLTGQTWTRKDVMNSLYKFLDNLDF
jgi:hypothetical protein